MTTIVAVLLPLAFAVDSGAADWECLAPLPEPNGGCIVGAAGDDIVVLGGTNWRNETKHWLKTIWRYDSPTNTWKRAGELPEAIAYAPTAQAGGGFYFAGGSDGVRTHRSLQFVDETARVRTVAPLAFPMMYTSAAMANGAIYVAGGGTDPAALSTWTNAFRSIDPATGRITSLPEYPGGRLAHVALIAVGDELFAFTGSSFDSGRKEVVNSSAAFAFSIKAQAWRPLKPFPFAVRGLSAVNLDGGHIYLAGGYKNDSEEFTAEAYIFDIAAGRYTVARPLPYRAMTSLVKSGEWLYCLGGEDRKKHRTNAVFRIRWKELLPR
jgi:N-acetylneuraminic acid mutarotase